MQYNEKQFDFSGNFNLDDAQKILSSLQEKTRGHNHLVENLDIKTLPKLSDIYLQNNAYLRNLHSALSSILLGETKQEGSNIDVIQVMILLYLKVKRFRIKDLLTEVLCVLRSMVSMVTLHMQDGHIMESATRMPALWMISTMQTIFFLFCFSKNMNQGLFLLHFLTTLDALMMQNTTRKFRTGQASIGLR